MCKVDLTDCVCPECGSSDLEFDGTQIARVLEDWTAGARWNHEFPDAPTGDWLTLQGYCMECGHEWAIITEEDTDETVA